MILIEYELVLGTHWLDLGAVALLGPYFWILESIFCLLSSRKALTRHLHQTCAQTCVIRYSRKGKAIASGTALEVPGVGESVNRNMTLVPRGESTRPQKLRRISWGLRGPQKLLFCPQKPHQSPWVSTLSIYKGSQTATIFLHLGCLRQVHQIDAFPSPQVFPVPRQALNSSVWRCALFSHQIVNRLPLIGPTTYLALISSALRSIHYQHD